MIILSQTSKGYDGKNLPERADVAFAGKVLRAKGYGVTAVTSVWAK